MTDKFTSNLVQALDCTSLSWSQKPAHMKATQKKSPLYMRTHKKSHKFDLRSYREIDVVTSKACVVLLITQAIASRNDIMTVDRT